MKYGKMQALMMKLDTEKAFDTVLRVPGDGAQAGGVLVLVGGKGYMQYSCSLQPRY